MRGHLKGATAYETLRKGSGVLGWCSPSSELDDGVMQDRRRRVRAEPLDGVRGPGCGMLLQAWDPLQSVRRGAVKVEQGQEGTGVPLRRVIAAAAQLTDDGPWVKSRRDSGGARRWWPREAPWCVGEVAEVVCRCWGVAV